MKRGAVWMDEVKVGDGLYVKPLYNKTERPHKQIENPAKVLAIKTGVVSQSGILFDVANKSGSIVSLDAGWFEAPAVLQVKYGLDDFMEG